MELREYLEIIKKRWLLLVIITVVTVSAGAAYSYLILKPSYSADISVIIGRPKSPDLQQNSITYSDILMYQQEVKTYSEFAKSRTLSEDIIQKLKLNMSPETVQGMITVAPKADTEFLTITVNSNSAVQAMEIANQAAKSLSDIAITVKKEDAVQLLDQAQLPTSPSSPRPIFNITIAFFLGVMLSIGVAFLLEYLDNTVKTNQDVEKLLGIPIIGTIPFVTKKDRGGVIA